MNLPEKIKKASLADALIGAPLGAISAALASKKEERATAIRRGLLLGVLLGFIQGQRSSAATREQREQPMSPALMSLLAGLGAGAITRVPMASFERK